MFEGQVVHTDSKLLTYAFTQKFDKASLKDRQLDLIAQYMIRIVHITGEQNTVANALFRKKEIIMLIYNKN